MARTLDSGGFILLSTVIVLNSKLKINIGRS